MTNCLAVFENRWIICAEVLLTHHQDFEVCVQVTYVPASPMNTRGPYVAEPGCRLISWLIIVASPQVANGIQGDGGVAYTYQRSFEDDALLIFKFHSHKKLICSF